MKLLLNARLRNAHKLWPKSSLGSSQETQNGKANAMQRLFRFSRRDEKTSWALKTLLDISHILPQCTHPDVPSSRVWHFMSIFLLLTYFFLFLVWAIMFVSTTQTKAESFGRKVEDTLLPKCISFWRRVEDTLQRSVSLLSMPKGEKFWDRARCRAVSKRCSALSHLARSTGPSQYSWTWWGT